MRTSTVFICLIGLCAAGLCLASDEDAPLNALDSGRPAAEPDELRADEELDPFDDEVDLEDSDLEDSDLEDSDFDERGFDEGDDFDDEDLDPFNDLSEYDDFEETDRVDSRRRAVIRMMRKKLFDHDEGHMDEEEHFPGGIAIDLDDDRLHQIEIRRNGDSVMNRQILVDQLTEKLFENPDDQELRQRLKKELDALFDAQTKIRERKIAGLEKRLARLRSQLQSRLEMKERIIELRLETLTNEAKGLTF